MPRVYACRIDPIRALCHMICIAIGHPTLITAFHASWPPCPIHTSPPSGAPRSDFKVQTLSH